MWKLLYTKSKEKYEPSIISSVQMWKLLYAKSKKKSQSVSLGKEPSLLKGQMRILVHHVKAAPCSSKEATMDSTVLSSLANSECGSSTRKGYPNPTSFPDSPQDKMETSSDNRILCIHTNLFGGTVFVHPSFIARKPTPKERAQDLQWDADEQAHDLEALAKAKRIQVQVVERVSRHKLSLPVEQFTKDGDAPPKRWWRSCDD
jgi:hypothetical protein